MTVQAARTVEIPRPVTDLLRGRYSQANLIAKSSAAAISVGEHS